MGLVHALVAEVLGELIHPAVAAHDEALEVELVGDAQVEGDVQGVVVRDEGTRRGAARDALQDRGLHLEAAGGIEVFAHRGDDLRPLDEHVADLRIDDQIHIALPVAELRIREGVEDLAVLLLDDRQHAQRLAQQGELLGVHAQLAGLGDEGETLDTDDVTDVQKLLPDGIVHSLVLFRADLIPLDIDLDPAGGILELAERSSSHNPAGHYPSRYAHFLEVTLFRVISFRNALGSGVYGIEGGRIRIDAQFP